jgi:excisionase family DNA binding protein
MDVQRQLPVALRPLLSVKEAAALLRVSPRSVYRWTSAGQLDSTRIAGTVRVHTAAVLRLLAERVRA